ncbi:hypothetical protein SAMD00019534_087790 [Acytostelium subglobosum LB1]|uniref:hypothetical protein n=1 Tax=Acytostelium subglobosum LB1 TaxID=1410327 RepID=UPI000644C360|nr:hypothetical protein SAMD00019534_087790 [Acytostelium subglobosum LB1]GAM25604.1 hypothetical protein SAMD00019534_087790 [Acytostelium subglobosum LB1]|eukprot:XP_012751590.1 hypothetical protein SAMD00019534_087790 [Acytostelium subglobosum LB1]
MASNKNFYDIPLLFERYSQIYQQYPEAAVGNELFYSLLPDVKDATVLDLGCGDGNFGRRLMSLGIALVEGYDLSHLMINRARELANGDQRQVYQVEDIETMSLKKERYNLIHSLYAFHYVVDLDKFMKRMYDALVPNGVLMFQVEHPVRTSNPNEQDLVEVNGRKVFPLSNYMEEGERVTTWLGVPNVSKRHHLISSYVNSCIKNGLQIEVLNEWAPASPPELSVRPLSLMIKARKVVTNNNK